MIHFTAFGRFPGVPVNPVEAVLGYCEHRFCPMAGECVHLETSYAAVDRYLQRLASDKTLPSAVIAFGYNAAAPAIAFEAFAFNRTESRVADVTGQHPLAERIEQVDTERRESRFPITQIIEQLSAAGCPVVRSEFPGYYLCNYLYYRLLSLQAHRSELQDVIFIHVPMISELAALSAWATGGGCEVPAGSPFSVATKDLSKMIEAVVAAVS